LKKLWQYTNETYEVPDEAVDLVVAVLRGIIPQSFCEDDYFHPDGYDDLVSCVLDAVGSVGVRYTAVTNGLKKFRAYVAQHELEVTTPQQFLDVFADHLNDEGEWFANNLWNHQRTSTRGGISKTFAVQQIFEIFVSYGIATTKDLIDQISNLELRRELESVKGQSRFVSLIYLYMLAGYRDGVKDDRMIGRWFERVLRTQISTGQKAIILMAATDALRSDFPCVDAHMLDHLIWLVESGRFSPSAQ
jgi:hypothetical protein